MRYTIVSTLALVLSIGMWTSTASAEVGLGDRAPGFSLTDQNGRTVSLSDYEGKVVVLEWFNEECPWVVRHHYPELRTMTALASKSAEKGVVWLAINSTSGKTDADNKSISDKWSISYPLLNDSDGRVGKAYGATTTPHMYIINTDGKVVYMGAIDNDRDGNKGDDRVNYVDKALKEVLAGQSVSEPRTRQYGCTVKYAN